jgi:GntR family transcriptional repressor for pyruvate dehydrogenase complex
MALSRPRLSDQVADELRSRIAEKQYLPGEKLPVEAELASQFGVSRITIREAVRKLDIMGIVEVRQGSGTYVREITPHGYIKTLFPMLSMDQNSLKDIFEIRQVIECKSAELAALNATPEDLIQVKKPLSRMQEAVRTGNIRQYDNLDLEFHYAVAKCTHNQVLVTIQELLSDLVEGSISLGLTPLNALEHSVVFHRKIYEAIAKKDSISASGLMNAHLEGGMIYASASSSK